MTHMCVDTVAASNVTSTSANAAAAAEKAFRAKITKYTELSRDYVFVPLAMETMGPWAADSLSFVKELGRMLAARTGEPRSTAFLLQSISIAVQRSNAASIMGTLPQGRRLDELFYIL